MTWLRPTLQLTALLAGAMLHEPVSKIESYLRQRREVYDMLFSLREAVTTAQAAVDGNPTLAKLETALEEAKRAVAAYAASPLAEVGECGGPDRCYECTYTNDCEPQTEHSRARDAYYSGVARKDKLHTAQKRYDEMLTSALRVVTGRTGQRR